MKKSAHLFAALSAVALLAGCNNPPPPPAPPANRAPAQTAPQTRPIGNVQAADPNKPVAGSAFNKMFPASSDGYNVTYTQEKTGFAQADVTQGGKKVATISVSDTLTNPSAKSKFVAGGKTLAGFPGASIGSLGTAVLVGDRFQVQVRSEGAALDAAGREAWIQKFNLDALSRLAGGK